MSSTYLIALGSNRRHHTFGSPRDILRAAMEELSALGTVIARAPVIDSPPMGPARRQFANGAAVLDSEYDPPALLAGLKRMEREFGRRKGRRWGDRVLDLDIILWSGGEWQDQSLIIPHVDFRGRDFVLSPAGAIAGDWRDPISGLTVRQLAARI